MDRVSTNQKYVAGSQVPFFISLTDYFPDTNNPDWTDLSSATIVKAQIRNGDTGEVWEVDAEEKSYTINEETVSGVEIVASDMAATCLEPGNQWEVMPMADLAGDGNLCYGEWVKFEVLEGPDTVNT